MICERSYMTPASRPAMPVAGLYVVQLVTDKFHYEFRFDTESLADAMLFAHKKARKFAKRMALGQKVTHTRVVLKTDGPDEIISTFPIPEC